MTYDFTSIERSWQDYWDARKTFRTADDSAKPGIYILDMFPYPSGAGLHVGHPEGYTATDIVSRYYRMKGYNVLHPMGWDAFGLPAERYAMQTNIHPSITTEKNISTFRRQIKRLGLSYDWDREVNTTDPGYYRWTQWIFLQLYGSWFDPRDEKAHPIDDLVGELSRNGSAGIPGFDTFSAETWNGFTRKQKHDVLAKARLAYIAEIPVNWCEGLGTVLANEEVPEWTEKGYTVERRPMKQWMMRITAYAERLLRDAEDLDWPTSTLDQQRNWIGKSVGAEIAFQLDGHPDLRLRVFTTRPDTLFGATYMVLAPEHPVVDVMTTPEQAEAVARYRKDSALKTELERGADKSKTGVFTGGWAVNPATWSKIPVWIADYVLMSYGTGAIMAVPAHDERDHEFATAFGLPIRTVVDAGQGDGECFVGEGVNVNSSNDSLSLDGLRTPEAKERIIGWLTARGIGKAGISYRLRDWLFSRQRYWGEPIPIVHLEDGTIETWEALPLTLPPLEKFQPSGTTESPLALAREWVEITEPRTGMKGRRETNTMPQWAGSCWYYLRFVDPGNDRSFIDPDKERRWLPVSLYIGGAEHAVLHLMYARFWHKVLYDLGFVSSKEPFLKLRHQGTILGEDSRKMSKSRGNVVNPDDVVDQYGADAFRLFEMFLGPLEEMKPWSTKGVEGVFRFLNRVWRLYMTEEGSLNPVIGQGMVDADLERVFHQTIRKVGEDIEQLRFNTAISQLMIFTNEAMKRSVLPSDMMSSFILLLAPFAPHIAEEIWKNMGHAESLACAPWPQYDERKLAVQDVEVILQVNGKVRSKVTVPVDTPKEELEKIALGDEAMVRHIGTGRIVKRIVVPNKLVNIVIVQT